MKFVKILPLCVLMLGLASCGPRTSTPTSSVKTETPSSETSKPTSSEKDTETSKESSSSESSTSSADSSTTETPVSNTKEIKPMEIYEANQDKVNTADKNKLIEDVTYMDVVFPKNTQLETTGGKTVTDVNGASFDSVGRINNVKKLTFTFTANTRLYLVFTNNSTSKGLLMTLKDSTGTAVKEFQSLPKKESGAEGTLLTEEYTTTSEGQFTLETGKYTNDEGVEDSSQGAATIFYMAIVPPTNA